MKQFFRYVHQWIAYKRKKIKSHIRARRHKNELKCLSHNNPEFLSGTGPVVIFKCQNEMVRLPYFLEYYRNIGVEGFIAVDNESTDGTVDYLLTLNDAVVYSATGNFRQSNAGIDWINYLLCKHIVNRWVLLADVDELLVYPGIEEEGIRGVINRAESAGDHAVYTPMVDMYPNTNINELKYIPGDSFFDTCSYFDGEESYRILNKKNSYDFVGGVRKRTFFKSEEHSPYLNKYSLVYWDSNIFFVNPHHIFPRWFEKPSIVAPLMHFKFLSDFHVKVEDVVENGQYWNDNVEYKAYHVALNEKPHICLYSPVSIKYQDSGSIEWLLKLFKRATETERGLHES